MIEEIKRLFTAKEIWKRKEISLHFLTNVALVSTVFKSNREQYDLFYFYCTDKQIDELRSSHTLSFASRTKQGRNTRPLTLIARQGKNERTWKRKKKSLASVWPLWKISPTSFLFSIFTKWATQCVVGWNRWMGCLVVVFLLPHSPPYGSLSHTIQDNATWCFYFVSPLKKKKSVACVWC